MEAQVWTLIGLLGGTVLGSFVYLGQKIDGLGGRIDGIEARMDRLSTRMDALAARVEDLGRELSDRIYEVAVKLDEHLRRHAS
jgi:hypothetical protein